MPAVPRRRLPVAVAGKSAVAVLAGAVWTLALATPLAAAESDAAGTNADAAVTGAGTGTGTATTGTAAAPSTTTAGPAADTTAAERLLFETDHLANLGPSGQLEYRFTYSGQGEFTDRVLLKVSGPEHRVEPDYLSGERHVNYPAVDGAHGNPVVLFFLESDLVEMQRLTQGRTDYFRRVIRRALAKADLAVEPIEVLVQGRSVHAQRVTLTPYHDDPNAATRFPAFIDKTYVFVLSPEVPGQVVELSTVVRPPGGTQLKARLEWTRLSAP